jgi:hypothetical protein
LTIWYFVCSIPAQGERDRFGSRTHGPGTAGADRTQRATIPWHPTAPPPADTTHEILTRREIGDASYNYNDFIVYRDYYAYLYKLINSAFPFRFSFGLPPRRPLMTKQKYKRIPFVTAAPGPASGGAHRLGTGPPCALQAGRQAALHRASHAPVHQPSLFVNDFQDLVHSCWCWAYASWRHRLGVTSTLFPCLWMYPLLEPSPACLQFG